MRPITTVLAAPHRRSRFHTERHELMPIDAWLRLPLTLSERVLGRGTNRPWIVPSAAGHLNRLLTPEMHVLEFGSGYSTAWYALRSRHVISIEHDAGWLSEVQHRITTNGLTNCELRQVDAVNFPSAIAAMPEHSFDLVVVDGNDTASTDRVDCVLAAKDKVRPGRYLLLDDADNARYRRVRDLLPDWNLVTFSGMKPKPLVATETAIYRRPMAH